jgi:hypothetical protein
MSSPNIPAEQLSLPVEEAYDAFPPVGERVVSPERGLPIGGAVLALTDGSTDGTDTPFRGRRDENGRVILGSAARKEPFPTRDDKTETGAAPATASDLGFRPRTESREAGELQRDIFALKRIERAQAAAAAARRHPSNRRKS